MSNFPPPPTSSSSEEADGFASPQWMADLHLNQFGWRLPVRIAWWALLWFVAIPAWAATKANPRVRYGAWGAIVLLGFLIGLSSGGDDAVVTTETAVEAPAGESAERSVQSGSESEPESTLDEGVEDDSSDAAADSDEPVTTTEPPSPSTTEAPASTTTAPALASGGSTPATEPSTAMTLLASLTVEDEPARVGYDRDLFDHWSDLDGDGCNTRYEVLTAESREPVETSDGCRPVSGLWVSAFDGKTTTDPSTFDMDHLVPLAEAWDSGADSWSASRREAFANDETSPLSLIAVSASSNRSKSDRDPAEWLPPSSSYHCTYVASWVSVKAAWNLSVDPAEKAAIDSVLTGCGDTPVEQPATTTTAPPVTTTAPPATTTAPPTTTAAPVTTTAPPTTTAPTVTTTEPTLANPGNSKNCSDFATQAEAQAWFDLYYPAFGDVGDLDRDGNLIPCESLP